MTFYTYLKTFTETYRIHQNDDVSLREAACIEVQSRYEFLPIRPGELLAGRKRVLPVGFSNEPLLGRSVCWFVDRPRAMQQLISDGASEAEIEDAETMLAFWEEQETRKNLRAAYPQDIKEAMPEDVYWEHSEVAFPLYRVVGAYLDYGKLLRLGIRGLKELERRANSDMDIAFAMHPTSIEQLMAIADAGELMPPKSTWFEPKLRSGLFIHELD